MYLKQTFKTLWLMLFVGIFSFYLPTTAQAETKTVQVKTSYTDNEILSLLKKEGYSAEIRKASTIVIKKDGHKIILRNKKTYLQLVYGATGFHKLTVQHMNEWNEDKMYSRAYLDSDNDVMLESEIELDEGLSEQQLLNFVRTFVKISVDRFRDFIKEKDK